MIGRRAFLKVLGVGAAALAAGVKATAAADVPPPVSLGKWSEISMGWFHSGCDMVIDRGHSHQIVPELRGDDLVGFSLVPTERVLQCETWRAEAKHAHN